MPPKRRKVEPEVKGEPSPEKSTEGDKLQTKPAESVSQEPLGTPLSQSQHDADGRPLGRSLRPRKSTCYTERESPEPERKVPKLHWKRRRMLDLASNEKEEQALKVKWLSKEGRVKADKIEILATLSSSKAAADSNADDVKTSPAPASGDADDLTKIENPSGSSEKKKPKRPRKRPAKKLNTETETASDEKPEQPDSGKAKKVERKKINLLPTITAKDLRVEIEKMDIATVISLTTKGSTSTVEAVLSEEKVEASTGLPDDPQPSSSSLLPNVDQNVTEGAVEKKKPKRPRKKAVKRPNPEAEGGEASTVEAATAIEPEAQVNDGENATVATAPAEKPPPKKRIRNKKPKANIEKLSETKDTETKTGEGDEEKKEVVPEDEDKKESSEVTTEGEGKGGAASNQKEKGKGKGPKQAKLGKPEDVSTSSEVTVEPEPQSKCEETANCETQPQPGPSVATPPPPTRKPGFFRGRRTKSLSSRGGRKEIVHQEEAIDPEDIRGFEHVERYVTPANVRVPKFWDSEDELSDDDSDNFRRIMCGFGTNCRLHEVIRPGSEIVRRLKELQNTFGSTRTLPLFPNRGGVDPEDTGPAEDDGEERTVHHNPIIWHNDPSFFAFANNFP